MPTHHRRSHLPLDELRERPWAVPEEIPGLLERLAEVPDLAIRAAYGTLAGGMSGRVSDPPTPLNRSRQPR